MYTQHTDIDGTCLGVLHEVDLPEEDVVENDPGGGDGLHAVKHLKEDGTGGGGGGVVEFLVYT